MTKRPAEAEPREEEEVELRDDLDVREDDADKIRGGIPKRPGSGGD